MSSPSSLAEKERKRRSDGERSRAAILDAAARLATVEGLEGLSIGRLAEHIGMSKSGLYAHFGSKEELQLAAIDRAVEIFAEEVVEPARRAGRGLARLEAVVDAFASYLERRVFPGGCFFNAVTAEIDSHPGAVREKLAELQRRWLGGLERWVQAAQEAGELDSGEDAAQLAFELNGMLHMGNAVFVLQRDPAALERARRGFHARLAAARAV
jgi:AcrR family transcriptional regulator